MTPIQKLLPRLDAVKSVKPGQWVAKCPAHDDKHPSLCITEKSDGTLLLKDWAGCSVAEILHTVGLELHHLFPDSSVYSPPLTKWGIRKAWDLCGWRAATNVLYRESLIVYVAGNTIFENKQLSDNDRGRLLIAIHRISDVKEVLL